jgi:hypothetical protein
MLKTCFELKRAFESLTQQDQEYTFAPTSEEWEKVRKVCGLLKVFFDATVVVSGSFYPTTNLHFHEIWEVKLFWRTKFLRQMETLHRQFSTCKGSLSSSHL